MFHKKCRRVVGLLLVALSLNSVCFAQDPNVDLMKKLYTKIGKTVGVGSNDAIAGESFLVLANPGILLDPTINTSTTEGRYQLSKMLDRVLLPSWIYKPNNDSTLKVYSTILNYKETPAFALTASQKQQLDAARAFIFSNVERGTYSPAYQRYLDTKRALALAIKQVEDYRTTHPNQSVPADLAQSLSEARTNFNLIGNKNQIVAAMNRINMYEHADPAVWWGELQGRFDDNTETFNGTQFPIYNLFPAYSVWLDTTRTWTNYTLRQSDIQQTTSNSHSSVGGGLSVGWGLWSVGADYSNQQNRTYFQLNASNATVKMELMRVMIDRPWMDDYVFKSRGWKWLSSSPLVNQLISDGGDAVHGVTPQGVMPFVPTGVLLARNVSLSADWSSDLKTTFDEKTSGGGSIGWGPFSFGGRTENSNASTYMKANAAGNTVSWSAPQIIGFFVEVLPENPKPNPCLRFASDAGPADPSCGGQPNPVFMIQPPTGPTPAFQPTPIPRRFTDRQLLNRATVLMRQLNTRRRSRR
jgi:hypothetical protein